MLTADIPWGCYVNCIMDCTSAQLVLKYIIRLCVCGCLAIYAGCFDSFIMPASMENQVIRGWGTTDCGCRRKPYRQNGCGG
jgi:hypothetical protein